MGNVKHVTNNGEILTTSCKRLSTALRRFTAFLKEYDSYYNEMLSELNSGSATITHSICDTEIVTITLTNDTDTYTLRIKHDVPDTDSTENDSTENDSTENDSTENDSTENDSTENDSTENDNKGYMRCEYFFSLDPKSPPKCKYCIYSDHDFCPADLERYKPFCDE